MSSASGEMGGLADCGPGAAPLATVVYSSRALTPLSDRALQELMRTSQARNQHERATGVMLYDNSRCFQWLEGPTEAVDRIMD